MVQKPKHMQGYTVQCLLPALGPPVHTANPPLPLTHITSDPGCLCFHPYFFQAYTNTNVKS